jgi:hypothetical protein
MHGESCGFRRIIFLLFIAIHWESPAAGIRHGRGDMGEESRKIEVTDKGRGVIQTIRGRNTVQSTGDGPAV